jgi:HemK-related putative methylase
MNSEIYSPEEDSYLMSENIKRKLPILLNKNPNLKFLEIGSGSGINLKVTLSLGIKKENILACDINKKAVEHCKGLGFNCMKSNLFEEIPKQKFDLIIFNPPYLPEDSLEPKSSKVATTAGKKGNEVIKLFLNDAKNFLSKKGKIFIITSSLSKEIDFGKYKLKFKILDTKKLFFEKLFLWELEIQ